MKMTQKTRRHVDRLMTSLRVPVVNVKYAQKHKHDKITLSTYVLLQLSCESVLFAIKNIKINWQILTGYTRWRHFRPLPRL